MSPRLILLAVCITVPCATAAIPSDESTVQTPELILTEIRNEGPAAVIRSLWRTQAKWSDLTNKVATGNQGWVDVAVALAPRF